MMYDYMHFPKNVQYLFYAFHDVICKIEPRNCAGLRKVIKVWKTLEMMSNLQSNLFWKVWRVSNMRSQKLWDILVKSIVWYAYQCQIN